MFEYFGPWLGETGGLLACVRGCVKILREKTCLYKIEN